jgi:hypothetical protein
LRVFEKRVLRKINGLKEGRSNSKSEKILNEKLHNSYSSLNIIRVMRSRRLRHVANN